MIGLLLSATVLTWGTAYGMFCPIIAFIIAVMEYVTPFVPPVDPKNIGGDPK